MEEIKKDITKNIIFKQVETISEYKANDGSIHKTKEACLKHEQKLEKFKEISNDIISIDKFFEKELEIYSYDNFIDIILTSYYNSYCSAYLWKYAKSNINLCVDYLNNIANIKCKIQSHYFDENILSEGEQILIITYNKNSSYDDNDWYVTVVEKLDTIFERLNKEYENNISILNFLKNK